MSTLEPLAQLGAVEDVGQHHLERAAPLGLEVNDLVDRAHAARGDAPDDPVAPGEDQPLLELLHDVDALHVGIYIRHFLMTRA